MKILSLQRDSHIYLILGLAGVHLLLSVLPQKNDSNGKQRWHYVGGLFVS